MLLEGSELTKEDRESQLYDDFEHFRQNKGETIHDYYVRFAKLINDMRNIKMTMSRMQLNSKFVNNMLPEWGRFVTAVKLNRGLRDSNYDQLYAYLKQHEAHANENKMMLDRFTQHTVDPLALMSNVSHQQYYSQSSTTPPSTYVQPHFADNTQLDSGLSPTDNLIENLTNTLALLTQSYKTYLPQTNNQLRTSSNPRNQATVQDGRVVVQNVQGRQNRGQGNNARGAGHIARNCTQPKHPQNSDTFKDQDFVMLSSRERADDYNAFNSDVDEAPTAQTMFMANLSSADPVYDEAGSSYDLDILSKGNRSFEQTMECYSRGLPFFLITLKELFEDSKGALTKEIKEMKDIFEELEAKVDQNVVNRKHAEIERKNLLIVNDNLIADCLSRRSVFYASNSECKVNVCTNAKDHSLGAVYQENRISPAKGVNKKKVEEHPRINKSNLRTTNRVDSSSIPSIHIIHYVVRQSKQVWKPKQVVQIILWYLDLGCSKHMTRDRSRLKNFANKFIGTVKFRNDHFGAIMGYGNNVIGDSMIYRVYYVEGLGHNLFSVGQFCDSDLEVAFRKHSCYFRDTNGVELIKGSHGSNLYTISIEDMMKSSPNCLLSKASKNKSWLWHCRLNHLNFGTINDLARMDIVKGLLVTDI
ncbi:retrovirus-related pol polyprotein from transposon TNT 1-94 [Tanacetum coccineum]